MIPLTRTFLGVPFTPHQVWLHPRDYGICLVPSIVYPLVVCHLNLSQLSVMQIPYLCVAKNKLNLSRCHSNTHLFGLFRYGGLGALDHKIEASLSSVTTSVWNLCTPSKAQSMLMFVNYLPVTTSNWRLPPLLLSPYHMNLTNTSCILFAATVSFPTTTSAKHSSVNAT